MGAVLTMKISRFNPNKSQIMRRWPPNAPESTQERKETIYAILAIGSILVASLAFLAVYWLSE